MFPLFYVRPKTLHLCNVPKQGYFPVVKQGQEFGILTEEEEFEKLADQDWVVPTFKKMLFLDQCYWD